MITLTQVWKMVADNLAEENFHEAVSLHYDLYKEVHGIRPRWYSYSEASLDELERDIAALERTAEEDLAAYERIVQQQKDEHKARIKANAYKPNLAFDNLRNLMRK